MAKLNTYNTLTTITPVSIADALAIDVGSAKNEYTVLVIDVTTLDSGATLELVASAAYSQGSQGNLAIPVTATGRFAISVETARFKSADGELVFALADETTLVATVSTIELP